MAAVLLFAAGGFLSAVSPRFESFLATVFVWGFGGAAVIGLAYLAFIAIADALFWGWVRTDNARLLADVERENRAEPAETVAGEITGGGRDG